ncbi:uncharacterized protein LOC100366908 [Saccoglossus kowalevskii]
MATLQLAMFFAALCPVITVADNFIKSDPSGPVVAGIDTNITISFYIYGEKIVNRSLHTHVDQAYFDFPPGFIPIFDVPRGKVDVYSILEEGGNSSTDFHLIDISEHLSGRYGVGLDGIEPTDIRKYVEVIVPAAHWQPKNYVVVDVGETITLTCMAVQYQSLVASTNLTVSGPASSNRLKRMTFNEGPNPVVSLPITIEHVSATDAGRYACTSQDVMDSSIRNIEMLDLMVTTVATSGDVSVARGQSLALSCWLPWLDLNLQNVVWYRLNEYPELRRGQMEKVEVDINGDFVPDALFSPTGQWFVLYNVTSSLATTYKCKVEFTIPQNPNQYYVSPYSSISVSVKEHEKPIKQPSCTSWKTFYLTNLPTSVTVTERDNDYRWSVNIRVNATQNLLMTIFDASREESVHRFEIVLDSSSVVIERYGLEEFDPLLDRVIVNTLNLFPTNEMKEFTLHYYYDTLRILEGIESPETLIIYNNFRQMPGFTRYSVSFAVTENDSDAEVEYCISEDVVEPAPCSVNDGCISKGTRTNVTSFLVVICGLYIVVQHNFSV